MSDYHLPYFGKINTTAPINDYWTKIDLNGYQTRVDIVFENKSPDIDTLKKIVHFLENIPAFIIQNLTLIKSDFDREGEAADYINFYLDELDESELSAIIDISNKSRSVELQLLDKLILANIWIYPDTENNFGVFHYSIELDGEPCNQLLTIPTNEHGEVNDITWES